MGIEILYDAMKARIRMKKSCLSKLDISSGPIGLFLSLGCDITTDGAHTLHRMIRKTFGNLEVAFRSPLHSDGMISQTIRSMERVSATSTLRNTGSHSQLIVRLSPPSHLDNTLDVTFLFFAKHVKSHSHMLKDLRILSRISRSLHQRQQSLPIHHPAVAKHILFFCTPLAPNTLYWRAHQGPRHHRSLR